jgi:hypothetical protein
MPMRIIQGASFDLKTTQLLGIAYERACENVAPDATVREALAKRIIEAARRGERDIEKLIEHAGLGKNSSLDEAGDGWSARITFAPSGGRGEAPA